MSLELESNNVDVNVHPTKHEVNFLYEDEIVEKIKASFEAKLLGCNETKELYTQQLLPGASDPLFNTSMGRGTDQTKETKIYAKDMIRSDSKEQKLEKFFGQSFTTSSMSQDDASTSKHSPHNKSLISSPQAAKKEINVEAQVGPSLLRMRSIEKSHRK